MTALRTPFGHGFTDFAAGQLAEALKAVAEPTRLKILALLTANGGLTVNELTEMIGFLTQPTVSYHVKRLSEVGLLLRDSPKITVNLRAVAAVASALSPWQAS